MKKPHQCIDVTCTYTPSGKLTIHRLTRKARIERIAEWIALFDAVIQLKPREIEISNTISHSFAIRDVANSAIKRVENGEFDNEPDSFRGDAE
jgi:hypothetical protein